MTTIKFEEIKKTARKRVSCDGGCGKKFPRQTTFSMTLNPFNKNPDGTIRTRQDIHDALEEKARAWEADTTGEWCEPCATRPADTDQ